MLARTVLATLTLATATMIEHHTANAAPYWPWCAQYYNRGTTRSCAYISREQCMESLGGIGGYCYTNPNPSPPAPPRTAKSSRHTVQH
jgi:uncharacterized protein DUF3551